MDLLLFLVLCIIGVYLHSTLKGIQASVNKTKQELNHLNLQLQDLNAKIASFDFIKNEISIFKSDLAKSKDELKVELNQLEDSVMDYIDQSEENIMKYYNFTNIISSINDVKTSLGSLNTMIKYINDRPVLSREFAQKINYIARAFMPKNESGVIGEELLFGVLQRGLGDENLYFINKDNKIKLINNTTPDAGVYIAGRILAIDSKFPIHSFNELFEKKKELFVKNVKAHINALSGKYILPKQTLRLAIMFIPSEAIYNAIIKTDGLLAFANQRRVLITSTSTLIPAITTIMSLSNDEKILKNIEQIKKDMKKPNILEKIFGFKD